MNGEGYHPLPPFPRGGEGAQVHIYIQTFRPSDDVVLEELSLLEIIYTFCFSFPFLLHRPPLIFIKLFNQLFNHTTDLEYLELNDVGVAFFLKRLISNLKPELLML